MGKKMLAYAKPLVLLFIVLIVGYAAFSTLVFFIPDAAIAKNVESSFATIEEEGLQYRVGSGYGPVTQIDMVTERNMLTNAEGGKTPLKNAFGGYSRYWNGYVSFLRPLLLFMDYDGIRYLNVFVLMLLFTAVVVVLYKKLGVLCGFAFTLSMAMCHIYILPLSMASTALFSLMMLAILFVCFAQGQMRAVSPFLCCVFLLSVPL